MPVLPERGELGAHSTCRTSYDKFKYKEVFLMENPFLGQMGVRRMDCCQTSGTTGYPGRQHGTYGSGGTISTPHDRMPPNGGGSSGVVSAVPESGLEECMNESLRNVELPVLPLDANSLTFGDWLVTIEPLVADVSSSAGHWWATTLKRLWHRLKRWERLWGVRPK